MGLVKILMSPQLWTPPTKEVDFVDIMVDHIRKYIYEIKT